MLDYSTPASSFGDRARRSKSGYVFNLPSIINLLTSTHRVVYSFSYLTYYQTLDSQIGIDCQEQTILHIGRKLSAPVQIHVACRKFQALNLVVWVD